MSDIHSLDHILGENIRTYRMEKQLSQLELAEAVDTTREVVSKYERGSRTPSLEMLKKISYVLGVSVDDLLASDDDPPSAENGYSMLNAANKKVIDQLIAALLLQQQQ